MDKRVFKYVINHKHTSFPQKLIPLLEKRGFYKTSDETIKGFCFRITNSTEISTKCNDACKLVNYLCEQGLAHNAFLTCERRVATTDMNDGICLRLFVWPREKPRLNKKLAPFNVGFCEIAGYVTVGCKFLFVFFFECEPIYVW